MLFAKGSKYRVQRSCTILVLAALVLLFSHSGLQAQPAPADARWYVLNTSHFSLVSQVSSRQTERQALALERWRAFIATVLPVPNPLPAAAVRNYVYLFADPEDYTEFTLGADSGFFYSTPRANFMAYVVDDEDSMRLALHHYGHFLLRNFADLRLPRWYEEALSAYASRIDVREGEARFLQYTSRSNEAMASISREFSMDRLLYRIDALASPRVIQIANLKAESLHYFLQHGYLEDGFPDRRQQLQEYLETLLIGRNARFAYDQAFDVTTEQLDAEFHRFLEQDSRPRIEFAGDGSAITIAAEPVRLSGGELLVSLGELALNAGRPENAELYFRAAMDAPESAAGGLARAYSGLGDSLRFQKMAEGEQEADQVTDQEIAALFQQALDRAPDNVEIVLDFGEYWEAELEDCDKTYADVRRQQIMGDIERSFSHALQLAPELPEVHLAMGEYYLLPGQDWRTGATHQQQAFSLLPADTFILEQAARYAIASDNYAEAERLIAELAQPMHFFGEPGYVTDLRERLLHKQRGDAYDVCAE